jgi:FkbH-like protein
VKITEALLIMQKADTKAPVYRICLACGFTPLHLQTFFGARLQQRLPDRRISIQTGLYGDLPGTLGALKDTTVEAVGVALEWFDLDPRLGYRGAGKWGPSATDDVVASAILGMSRVASAIESIPGEIPVAISLPTLPLTPLFHMPGDRLAVAEMELERALLEFGVRLLRRSNCTLVRRERLAEESAPANRFDLKSDLLTGLPYTLPHADAVALALARLLVPDPPKKGLITDLDDTLWCGIVGEAGADGISWDLAGHSQLHGLYQQLLSSLAEEGVLIGIASKNDPAVVKQALEREDMRIHPQQVFPIEVSWHAKSAAVGRILRQWNIGAESVVFVDDSPMELAEVAAAHPGIECILFPKEDYSAGYAMLQRLRDLFGKARISPEDQIRLESIRQGAIFQKGTAEGDAPEGFLEQAGATITVEWHAADDPRVLELVNKTNQFNLNGVRHTSLEWKEALSRPGAWMMAVHYADKFGPLGTIAVLQGHRDDRRDEVRVETWVMSCRAFSRRIEYQCLKLLFEHYQVAQIVFDFRPTAKNGRLQDFFASLTGERPEGELVLSRARFQDNCPPLYHRVSDSFETAAKN